MEEITTVLGAKYKLSELDKATVEHSKDCSQVLVWKNGKYIIAREFDKRPEAESYCADLNIRIHDAKRITAKTVPMEEYANFAKAATKATSSIGKLLDSLTAEQREDYDDILHEYPDIDVKWLVEKIANNQYRHFYDHNFNWIGRELVYQRHPQLPDWLSYYIDFRRYTEDLMYNNPDFKVTNCGVYQFF